MGGSSQCCCSISHSTSTSTSRLFGFAVYRVLHAAAASANWCLIPGGGTSPTRTQEPELVHCSTVTNPDYTWVHLPRILGLGTSAPHPGIYHAGTSLESVQEICRVHAGQWDSHSPEPSRLITPQVVWMMSALASATQVDSSGLCRA